MTVVSAASIVGVARVGHVRVRAPSAWYVRSTICDGRTPTTAPSKSSAVTVTRRKPDGPPQRAGEEAEPDDARVLDAREHLLRELALEHAPFELEAFDEERREHRVEARRPEEVERPSGDDREIDVAAADVGDRRLLVVGLPVPPERGGLDPERATGEPLHRGDDVVRLRLG